ncbi:hypothetical protein BRC77_10645 [Halobacteriales archaeon QH_8_64_26]|nr:MAG: hypothetical protein BRC77_10645 [Halobacteriales archaeon QH_8_64_26]
MDRAEAVEGIAGLSDVPLEHDPEAHRSFYIATDDYREKRLADLDGDAEEFRPSRWKAAISAASPGDR